MRKILLLLPLMIGLTAVLAFALVQRDSGEAAGGGPEMSLSAHGNGVTCDGQPSETKGAVEKPLKCDVPVGGQFTLSIDVNQAPANGYAGFQTWVNYGAVLTYKKAVDPWPDEIVWPDCDPVMSARFQAAGSVNHGCLTGLVVQPKSNHLGNIVELVFNCPTKSSNGIDLIEFNDPKAGQLGSVFWEYATGQAIIPKVDSLGINCVNPPPEPPVNYTCYFASNGIPLDWPVIVENQFGPDSVTVWEGLHVCPVTDKEDGGFSPLPMLQCFNATGSDPGGETVLVEDQYGVAEHIIGPLAELCVPATKDFSPFPPEPYYACYDSFASVPTGGPVLISNQFVPIDQLLLNDFRAMLCVPSLKDGGGALDFPPLTCYPVLDGQPVYETYPLSTQFYAELPDPIIEYPDLFCTEATKLVKLPHPGDTDGDGCSDQNENGPKGDLGGGRDWLNPYDYYDTGNGGDITGVLPQPFVADGTIDLPNDILGTILNYTGNPGYAPTHTGVGSFPAEGSPNTGFYRVAFDRNESTGANHWNRTGRDGVIDLPNDILGVILQYSDNASCLT